MDENPKTSDSSFPEPDLDHAALRQFRELFGDAFDAAIREYLMEAENLVAAARAAASRQDTDGLTRAVHSLKSTSGTVGAQTLSRLCAEIELLAHRGDMAAAAVLLPALADEHQAAARAIQALGSGS